MGLYQYSIISQTIAVLWRISTLCPCYLDDGKRGKARTNYPKQRIHCDCMYGYLWS